MLTLNGIKFAPVHCATGARGFIGEGYPFHQYWRFLGMDWNGTGLSGKTMTFKPRKGSEFQGEGGKPQLGNMPLKEDGMTPQEVFPKCIVANFARHGGEMLNAVSLSNFGLEFYLKLGKYQALTDPFFVSVLLDASDPEGKKEELREICRLIWKYRPYRAPMAIQINYGCPNSGHDLTTVYTQMCEEVELVKSLLGIPVFVNCNALMPTPVLVEVSRIADGLWIGNTIPWRAPETIGAIDWETFGKDSPIRRRGFNADGGLSSHQCLSFTSSKVALLRAGGVKIPIVAGNGIRTREDVNILKAVGADGIFIGSLAVVRPLGMRGLIQYANEIFSQ